jgi:hypothetical protein
VNVAVEAHCSMLLTTADVPGLADHLAARLGP